MTEQQILFVDDDPAMLNHIAQQSLPDLVLLDWLLPAMAGEEVVSALRSALRD